MQIVNANDLKKHGISASCKEPETMVTVRGRPAYVVLTLDKYESLSEAELSLAMIEAERDYQEGKYVIESVEQHVKRIGEEE